MRKILLLAGISFCYFITTFQSIHAQPAISTEPDSFDVTINVCNDSIQDTLEVYNTGTSDLIYTTTDGYGQNYDSTSHIEYSTGGATTFHTFDDLPTYSDSMYLTVTINGDFDESNEYADLYIEGNFIQTIPDNDTTNGTDIIIKLDFTDPNVSNWLQDGMITVRVENSSQVGSFVGTDYHQVQMELFGADWINTALSRDTIAPGDTTFLPVTFSSTNLDSGVYTSSILLSSNDPNDSLHIIPVTLTVNGYPKIALSDSCLKMDTIVATTQTKKRFWIYNTGCNPLIVNNMTTSLPEFTVDTTNLTIQQGDSAMVEVTFSANSAGTYNDILQIQNNDNDTSICLEGVAIPKPTAQIWPDSLFATLTNCCDTVTKLINVHNAGGIDLRYNIEERYAEFDGSGDYIPLDNAYQFTGNKEVTVEAWIKTNYGGNQVIASYDRSEYWRLEVNGDGGGWGEIGFSIRTDAGVRDFGGNTRIDDGTWHHVTAVFNNGDIYIYIDGVLDASTSYGSTFGSGTKRFGFIATGSDASVFDGTNSPSRYFNGSLDEIRVWDKALSQSEIQSRMNRPLGYLPNDLNNYWNFNDSTAKDLADTADGETRGNTYFPRGGPFNNVSNWYSFTNGLDTVAATDTAQIGVTFKNCGLLPGVYNQQFLVKTGDPANSVDTVFAQLTVGGSPTIALSNTCLNLDSIAEYTTHKDTFQVWNNGCDTLTVADITNNLTEFSVDTTNFPLLPGDTMGIVVTFAPTSPGTYTDTLNILNNDQDTTVCLTGDAHPGAVIGFDPDTLDVTITACNDSRMDSVKIFNTGGSNLIYNATTTSGDTVSMNSFKNFACCGDATDHTFTDLPTSLDSLYIIVRLNGDFDGSSEYADLYMDGDFIEQIPDGNPPNGTDIIVNYAFGGPQLQSWLADGQITVTIDNSSAVGGFVGTEEHEVTLYYNESTWLQIDSNASDTVAVNDTTIMPVLFDATGLSVGTYFSSIIIDSNDPQNPKDTIPAILTVLGSEVIALSDSCMSFDSTMAYRTKDQTLTLYNRGCDTLSISSLSTSTAAFSADTNALTIHPFDSASVTITFAPTSAGSYIDTLQIINSDNDTLVCLSGTAYPRPDMSVSPDTFFVNINSCSDTTSRQLTIYNNGSYPLNYFLSGDVGYDSTSTQFYTTSDEATDHVFSNLGNSDSLFLTIKMSGDFNASYEYADLYIDGDFIEEIPDGNPPNGTEITVDYAFGGTQLDNWLSDGQVTVRLDNSLYVDGVTSDRLHQVRFQLNGLHWLQVDTTQGITAGSDSSIINFTFSSTNLTAGVYWSNVFVNGNDPLNPTDTVVSRLSVSGTPTLAPSDTCMDLDSIMEYTTSTDTLWLHNTGCDTLFITSMSTSTTEFSIDTNALTILPFDSTYTIVTFAPTAPGVYTDDITILNNDQDTTICLQGEAYPSPTINYDPDSLEATINSCCDSTIKNLTIYNNGGSNLTYNFRTGFFDDFENGLNKWTINGTWGLTTDAWQGNYALTESPSGNYGNNFYEFIALKDTLTVTDASNCELSFYHKRDMECCCDYLHVQISVNGGFWQNIQSWNCNAGWGLQTFNLDPYVDNGDKFIIRFHFDSDFSVTYDGSFIDNVRITGANSLPAWLTITPSADTIAPGDSIVANVEFNSCGLPNGTYFAEVKLNSNDPQNPSDTIPTKMVVNGDPSIALSDSCMSLDSIMAYQTTEDTLTIYNMGCDTLDISNMTTATAEFSVDTNTLIIPPFDSTTTVVTFAPSAAGFYSDTLAIVNNDTDRFVCLSGYATPPPAIATDPDSFDVTINSCCDSLTRSLKIYNNGNSPLDWNINLVSFNGIFDNFNPTFNSALWDTIIGGSTDVGCGSLDGNALHFEENTPDRRAETIALNVSNGGDIIFYLKYGKGGGCETLDPGDEMSLQYNSGSGWQTITTYSASSFDTFTKVIESIPPAAQTNNTQFRWIQTSFCGFDCDEWAIDNVTINNNIFVTTSSDSGQVASNDSTTLTIEFNSCNLPGGTHYNYINIQSNDPQNPIDTVTAKLTINGTPSMALSDTCLMFDSTLVGNTRTDSFAFMNTSCDTLDVSSMNTSTSDFSISTSSLKVPPYSQRWVTVDFMPGSQGTFEDTVDITTNDGDTLVCLSGVGVGNAIIDPEPDTFNITLNCGAADTQLLKIHNIGMNNLTFSINDTISWLSLSDTADTVAQNDSALIQVYISTTGLGVGQYTGNLIINSNDQANPQVAVPFYLNVQSSLPAPQAYSASACEGDSIPPLIANGTSIQWYDDSLHSTMVFAGDTFFTGDTTPGVYTYYVTQTDTATGCESPDTAVSLTISSSSSMASGVTTSKDTVCLGDSSQLTVVGGSLGAGADWTWYADSCGGTPVATGSSVIVAPSTTTYYYVRAEGFCDSTACVSDSVVVVNSAPQLDATDTTICQGDTTPPLIAVGSNVKWYSDPNLSILVHTGDTFYTGLSSGGTYNFYVTQNVGGCQSPADTSTLVIVTASGAPSAATASPDSICDGDPTVLNVSGGSLGAGASWNWYSGSCGGTFVGSGSAVVVSPSATTSYFVRAESACDTTACASVTVTVTSAPSAPVAADTSVCEDEAIPPLTASGSNLKWYSDAALTTQVGSGNNFNTGDSLPGSYTYYVTQTIGNCESPANDVTLTIYSTSTTATGVSATSDSICSGNSTMLSKNGGSLGQGASWRWYSSSCGGTPEGSGSSITVAPSTTTTYFVRAEGMCDTTACQSITITVGGSIPPAPTTSDTSVCAGNSIPDLTASGTNITWYSDASLTNQVHSGSSFPTGHTNAGSYTYYATQTQSGCESPASAATLTIHPQPLVSAIAMPSIINQGDTTTLSAFNAITYTWQPNVALSSTTGATVKASPSTDQTYIVTGTDSMGCSDTAHVKVEVGPTGLPANAAQPKINIYPNPTLGEFTVTIAMSSYQGKLTLTLLNTIGQVMEHQQLKPVAGMYKANFDLSKARGGIFYLRIASDNHIFYRKVIVQN